MQWPADRHMSNRENGVIEEAQRLRGLKAAAYIAKSLSEGKKKEQIVEEFGGDKQLVEMLWSFAYHNRWLAKEGPKDNFVLTEKGRERVSRLLKSFAATSAFNVMYGTTVAQLEHLLVDVVV